MAKNTTKKSTPSGLTFKADGVVYGFAVKKFFVPGFGELTPEDALKNAEVLAFLVNEKSQVIAKAEDLVEETLPADTTGADATGASTEPAATGAATTVVDDKTEGGQ